MPTVADITAALDAFAPPALAADWDNVGLLLGDSAARVERILTCLTVTPEVAAEAVEGGYELIVTHHPILFRGAKRLTTATPEGRAAWLATLAHRRIISSRSASGGDRGRAQLARSAPGPG